MGTYPSPVHWSRQSAQDPGRGQALRALRRDAALTLPGWHAPRTVDELAAVLSAQPEALILAGGTDVGLWVTKQLRELSTVVYLGEIEALQRIDIDADTHRGSAPPST